MSIQTVSSDFWEAQLPEDWLHKPAQVEGAFYFESPDHTAGVYFSGWRANGQSLAAAVQDARAAFKRNLRTAGDGPWDLLKDTEVVVEGGIELVSEYFNRSKSYRIESRILGRGDTFVAMNFHDYACTDLVASVARSSTWVESLRLREATVEP